ncbi:MAG TPA: response regulator [Pyrinomonadaceae bacterium]|nr:response regulator [Pyrinomonadaceae bacterium]
MPGPVLVIEDEPDIAEVLRYSLQSAGFQTLVARNGEEGLQTALDPTNRCSLILLDSYLPGLSGADTHRRLRSEPLTHRTPIIIIGPKGMEFDTGTLIRPGAHDYIVKPFSVRKVVAQVRSLLPGSG